MNYNTTVEYIDSFINFEKIPRYNYASSFKLERMRAFLKELGNPHEGLKTIHIAGSKGKGSTSVIAAYILKEAGYKVGLYTSPHLVDCRERIRILAPGSRLETEGLDGFEGCISENEFSDLIEKIKPAIEKFRDHKELGKASFFEVLTACAFLYFKEKGVDFTVLETGLGGRLDATNVTEPLVCGISNISFEHTDKLGNSLRSIAREKAGIIKGDPVPQGYGASGWRVKGGGLVVSAPQEKEAMDVIRDACREKNVRLCEVGKDIKYFIVKSDEKGQIFDLEGPGYSYKNLEISMLGAHQVENAALAVGMVKAIADLKIDEGAVQAGLKNASWPGRLQIIQQEPYLIVDGAHNVASIKALISSIKEIFDYKRLICIFGISKDKDIKGVTSELDRASDVVILTKSKCSARALDPIYLKQNFSKAKVEITNEAAEALEKAFGLAQKQDLILVTGSLFLVGDILSQGSTLAKMGS